MKTRLLNFWESLNSSFWFLPLFIILLAIGAAAGLVYLDTIEFFTFSGRFSFLLGGGYESARSVLSVMAGAMLGVAGTVFSITLVALTLASSQFGARLLRNFMYDRLNQVVLGVYVATFLYCLIVLRTVKSVDEGEFVPNLSVLFALMLAVGSIILLIIFIHHISVSIQADHVIADVDEKLGKNLEKLYPAGLGEEDPVTDHETLWSELREKYTVKTAISLDYNGYLQAIDNDGLMKLAKELDFLLKIHFRPGEFLVKDMEIATVYSKVACEENALKNIAGAFILGKVRTPTQDAEFAIDQLVEIAARALSSGINDPYTAITCIDRLCASMCYLAGARFPSAFRYDDNQLRIMAKAIEFAGMMDAAFNQIRQFGKDSPSVLIRLMEVLVIINGFARGKTQKETVLRHAQMVLNMAEEVFPEKNDLGDMKERYRSIQAAKEKY
jgi:uncharacterized membrane protein